MNKTLQIPLLLTFLAFATATQAQTTTDATILKFSLESHDSFAPRIGSTFPEIDLIDTNGKRWNSETLTGKVVYLNFWSTGCGPCLKEMPELNTAFTYFSDDPDVVILSINCFDTEVRLNQYLKNNEMRMPVCKMGMEVVDLISANGVSSLPTHFIIDQDWNLAIAAIGGKFDIDKKLIGSIEQIANREYKQIENKEPNQAVDTTAVSAPR
ncbi:redoxin domain-containing protein [Pelagicoccus sp. SDUM812003]|nr:redoxin domain-containing protein [Pelagicoccus sp. SDUM812003]MDQ8202704.1 redoxin domain-containing protein [Pelagicoccus sp. SDUM812003]